MNVRISRITVTVCAVLVLVLGLRLSSQAVPPARYRLLATSTTGTMQEELSQAAAANYRIVTAWWRGTDEMMMLLEQADASSMPREYRLLAALNPETLASELEEVAAEGFRVIPHGVLRNPTLTDRTVSPGGARALAETVLLLERIPGDSQRYEYHVIAPDATRYQWDDSRGTWVGDTGLFQSALSELAEAGYDVVAVSGGTALGDPLLATPIVIGARPAGGDAALGVRSAAEDRYRLLLGPPGRALQLGVDRAAADGYRLASVSTVDFPDPLFMDLVAQPDHLVLIMEHGGVTLPRFDVHHFPMPS